MASLALMVLTASQEIADMLYAAKLESLAANILLNAQLARHVAQAITVLHKQLH